LITLRSYQIDGETKIRQAFAAGHRAPLYVLPTGGGKTILFASIAQSADRRGKRVLILAHRVELVDQIVEALRKFDVNPDIIAAGYQRSRGRDRATDCAVAVASVQTLVRRLDSYPAPTLIICDEAHHCAVGNAWSTVMRHYRDAKSLGVTATPARLDGHGLASTFDHLICGPNVPELIALGFLVRPRVWIPPTVDTSGLHVRMGEYRTDESTALMDTPAITGNVLTHYHKHGEGRPGLIFCTSVQHAHNVAQQFRNGGVSAVALDGGTDREIRRMAVQDFRDGKIKLLASCDLFSEGFDVPGAHIGILLRPTASEGLFLQQVGRLLRPAPGKENALILDHVGNTQRFGMPDEAREWKLTTEIIHRKRKVAGVRVCPKCFAASPPRAKTCVDCSHVFPIAPRQELEERDGELVELTAEQIARRRGRQEQGQIKELQELIELGRRKGYKDPQAWALFVWNGRAAKKRKPKDNQQALI
jgi:superfamily II DNA or RNA helicase